MTTDVMEQLLPANAVRKRKHVNEITSGASPAARLFKAYKQVKNSNVGFLPNLKIESMQYMISLP